MRRPLDIRRLALLVVSGFVVSGLGISSAAPAQATPALVMDVATGDVLYQQDATEPWFPASTTKLMTVYVALSAVRDHKIAMDTPLVVSARAHKMPPSKMGFAVGTQVTLENALKMLMVRSANDIAITVAEGVAGSVEAFADDMNAAAAQLGLHESHFVNPNGLPNPDHVSSARDMALIARALYAQFPEQAGLFNLGSLSLGSEIIPNHNNLLGRYPGADGMKTGFTCAAGFNVVASAARNGRRLVVVVMGAPSVAERTEKVAALFDRGFAGIDRPIASAETLPPSAVTAAPDMHDRVCRNRAALIAEFQSEVDQLDAALTPTPAPTTSLGLEALNPARAFLFNTDNVPTVTATAPTINALPPPVFEPVPVHIGAEPGYAGVVAEARAPHTPIGSEPQPAAAEAYAAAPPGQRQQIGGTPLAVDEAALPLRGRHGRFAQRSRSHMKAAAEAPQTKIVANAEDNEDPGAPKAKPAKVPSTPKKRAASADDPKAKRVALKPAGKSPKVAGTKPTASKVAAPKSTKAKTIASNSSKRLKSAAGE